MSLTDIRNITTKLGVILFLAALSFTTAPPATSQEAAWREFGYGDLRPSNWPIQNLLVIRYVATGPAARANGYTAFFQSHNNPAAIKERIFDGPSSVAAFLDNHTPLDFELTDEQGIFVTPRVYNTLWREKSIGMRDDLLRQAHADLDFSAYDKNGDKIITPHELAIVVIAATTPSGSLGGAVRDVDADIGDGYRYVGGVAAFGEGARSGLMSHEILHIFGLGDLYGPGFDVLGSRWNLASNMGQTSGWVHLDPWYKMRLGWSRPVLHHVNQLYTCARLDRAQSSGEWPGHAPVLIHDPTARPGSLNRDRFFLMEYRAPLVRPGGIFDFDSALAPIGAGVAIWFVQPPVRDAFVTDGPVPGIQTRRQRDDRLQMFSSGSVLHWGPNRRLDSIPQRARDKVGRAPPVNIYSSPDGRLGYESSFWTADDNPISLNWGRDLGIEIRIAPLQTDGAGRVTSDHVETFISRKGTLLPPFSPDPEIGLCYTRVTGETAIDYRLTPAHTLLFGIKPDGSLVRHWHLSRDFGLPDWTSLSEQMLSPPGGWTDYSQVIAAENGVFYAVRSDGSLVWFRHIGLDEDGNAEWANDGRETVVSSATNWSNFSTLAYGGDGVIYASVFAGPLFWFRHLDRLNGSNSWSAPRSGTVVHWTWPNYGTIISAGDGVIYGRRNDGRLAWYRHLGWETGAIQWEDRSETPLSPDPAFADAASIVSGGEGVIYAVRADGWLAWYRHLGWEDGSPVWGYGGEEQVVAPFSGWGRFVRVLAGAN